MNKNYLLPANIKQLLKLAETFQLAVDSAVEKGLLTRTFTGNAAMRGLSIPHAIQIVTQEIGVQTNEAHLREPA